MSTALSGDQTKHSTDYERCVDEDEAATTLPTLRPHTAYRFILRLSCARHSPTSQLREHLYHAISGTSFPKFLSLAELIKFPSHSKHTLSTHCCMHPWQSLSTTS